MNPSDATYEWNKEVNNSTSEAESVERDIESVIHALKDLTHVLKDLRDSRFENEEDYVVYQHARQLWDIVSAGTSTIRNELSDARSAIEDLRRAVEFYRHK
ncbi:hypothetical protein HWD35_10240 [Tsukamurella tyrosinosolvens]|uniref:hypothetical protein n=1 Tax=Tsukamurella tyrosinosolvens TaxID=57704 RepID=UPI001CE10E1B|nr:hypothetical protein [Tsukamurella tyrosinosolvens]MCA4995090.1 hypothetical protein [Tsukamurella tyrosinosolvens]